MNHDDREKALKTINLLDKERLGAMVGVVGYLYIIKSAEIGINEERLKLMDVDVDIERINIIQEKTASLGEYFLLLGNSILFSAAEQELNLEREYHDPDSTIKSLNPQFNITFGYYLNVISDLIKFIGTQQRVQEAGTEVTVHLYYIGFSKK